jgi:hypothetical protein
MVTSLVIIARQLAVRSLSPQPILFLSFPQPVNIVRFPATLQPPQIHCFQMPPHIFRHHGVGVRTSPISRCANLSAFSIHPHDPSLVSGYPSPGPKPKHPYVSPLFANPGVWDVGPIVKIALFFLPPSCTFLHFFAFFCTSQKVISHVFKRIRAFPAKTPGVGARTVQTDPTSRVACPWLLHEGPRASSRRTGRAPPTMRLRRLTATTHSLLKNPLSLESIHDSHLLRP